MGGEFVARSMQRLFEELNAQPFRVGNNAIRQGVGTPNGSVVGDIGDLYLRQDSAAAGAGGQPGLYFKGRNNGTNTGWAIVPPFVRTETSTGTLTSYDIKDASVVRWNNASLTTINSLKAGYDGQQVTFISIGAGRVDLVHQQTGSVPEDRLVNFATTAATSLAAGNGYASYIYDGTTLRWRLVVHEQGAWLTRTFAAGNFTGNGAMTWTLTAADVTAEQYWLHGKTYWYAASLANTTVGGTPDTQLLITIPGGFNIQTDVRIGIARIDNGTSGMGEVISNGAGTQLICRRDIFAANAWAASVDNTSLQMQLCFEVG